MTGAKIARQAERLVIITFIFAVSDLWKEKEKKKKEKRKAKEVVKSTVKVWLLLISIYMPRRYGIP